VGSSYFKMCWASFCITFLSPETAVSTNRHVLFSVSRTMMSGLLLGMVLYFFACWFHKVVTLFYDLCLLVLIRAHTGVPSLTSPPFPCVS
jgi:hypothetical protein